LGNSVILKLAEMLDTSTSYIGEIERQDLTKRIMTLISNDLEQILQPENSGRE
jgi:hypothetical protein